MQSKNLLYYMSISFWFQKILGISLFYCKTFENQKVLDDHAYIISSYPFLKSLSDILGYKCN